MKKILATLCTIAALSSLTGFAMAAPPEGHDNFGPGMHRGFGPGFGQFNPEQKAKFEQRKAEIQKRLNLTPEQKDKMKALHQTLRTQMKPLFDQMRDEHEKMMQLRQSNAAKEEIQAQREKIKALRKQIRTVRESQKDQMDAILTPSQRTELKKIHDEHKAEFGKMKWNKRPDFDKQDKE